MIYRNITMLTDKKIGLTTRAYLYFLIEKSIEFVLDLLPDRFIDTVANRFSLNRSLNDADVFQFLQMLRNGCLCQPQLPDQIIADTGLLIDDVLKYGHPCRVCQDLKQQGQPVLFVSEYF